MPRGGWRNGGRPKNAPGYPDEPTSQERIPESVANELMPMLKAGDRVKVIPESEYQQLMAIEKTYRLLVRFALKGLAVTEQSDWL